MGIGIGRFVYTPILPFMTADLGLTPAEGGLIASANYLGHLLGALAAARAHLPGGHRPWLLGALAVSAATTAAMGLTTAMAAFVVLRFAGGMASALAIVLATALVLERLAVYTESRSAASELTTAAVSVAVGATAFKQLTPGVVSLGPALATAPAQQAAIASFPLGAGLGSLWYGVFPVTPSPLTTIGGSVGLALAFSLLSAFGRQYELVVLRVATLTDAAYEWEHHVVTAMEAGLDEEEIDRVRGGGDATGWSHEEAALLRAVDECIADRCIRESTLDALGESFPPEQILDIIATVTMYHAMAIVTRTFEIPIDEKKPSFSIEKVD